MSCEFCEKDGDYVVVKNNTIFYTCLEHGIWFLDKDYKMMKRDKDG